MRCPYCGNTKSGYFGDNGLSPASQDYTLLCSAPIPEGEQDSFDRTVGAPKTGDVY